MGKGRSGQLGEGHNLCLFSKRGETECGTAEIWDQRAGLFLGIGEEALLA